MSNFFGVTFDNLKQQINLKKEIERMIYRFLMIAGVLLFSFAFTNTDDLHKTLITKVEAPASEISKNIKPDNSAEAIYNRFLENNTNLPAMDVFEKAMQGYNQLEKAGKVKNKLLTVVDFNLSSVKKRIWILDMETKKVLFNTYVAHGQNSGGEFATKFSNIVNSFQSSLGFYLTAETYYGKNGLSLFIDGQEEKFNSKARERYVVIHGSNYAEKSFIDRAGRLGRSQGCPAVPNTLAKELINIIKGKSVVFIYKNDENYLENSKLLNS